MPQSTIFKLAAVAVAAITLSACSKGVSVGVENTVGNENSLKTSVDKSKTVTGSTSAKVSATLPASTLIAQTLRPLVALSGINLPAYVRSVKYDGADILQTSEDLKKFHLTGSWVGDAQVVGASQLLQAVKARSNGDAVQNYAIEVLSDCVGKMGPPKPTDGLSCVQDFYTRSYMAAGILATTWPEKQLRIPGTRVNLADKEIHVPPKQLRLWVSGASTLLSMSEHLQKGWVAGLEGLVLRDLDSARVMVAQKLMATPVDDIKAAATRLQPGEVVVSKGDLSAVFEVFLVERNEYITQSEKGLILTRNGAVWHGDGLIAGAKTDIALDNTTTASVERKKSVGVEVNERSGGTSKTGVSSQ